MCILVDMGIEVTLMRDIVIDTRWIVFNGNKMNKNFLKSYQFCQVVTLYFLLLQVNPEMVARLEKAGLSFTGKDETGQRMEVSFSYIMDGCIETFYLNYYL